MADYSQSVNLPKTEFPMKGDLPKREPEFLEFWKKLGLYEKLLASREGKDTFTLHDGPPYANGHIHIGHALNKILKDMVVKSRALDGLRTPFVPGWDCHGLPIEQALLKEMKVSKRGITDVPAFRKNAAAFAQRWIDVQRDDFKRLGILGDWDRPYTTMSPEYESGILRAFRVLMNAGFIYRGLKPVYWCTHCETALAEAEIEYKDKTSPFVYVAFPVTSGPFKKKAGEDCSVVVWTTTPWTLPANVALAFHPDFEYVRVRVGKEPPRELVELEQAREEQKSGKGEGGMQVKTKPKASKTKTGGFKSLIVAKSRLAAVMEALVIRDYEVLETRPGKDFEGLKADHPLGLRESVGVLADYVTADDGTGIVHTAPGHGRDDFDTGRRYDLPILSPVDPGGRFTKEAGPFQGLTVYEGNEKIIESLKIRGRLLASGDLQHSYPHCWRCKNPIIFRATEQWWLGVDHKGLRRDLLDQIKAVKWMPAVGESRIAGMLKLRPDWCLSRQRTWGTPIPIVYCEKCGKPETSNEVLLHIETRAAKEGTDFWFAEEPAQFLPKGARCSCGHDKFRKETDILDVWVDSGCSWLSVLKGHDCYPAQLYLEGSDQHRGWFQSSLVLSAAMEGRPPYEAVLTHGFVLDESGRAMHKSLGNVVSPQTVVEKNGADVLRLWVALSDVEQDVRLSAKLLDGPVDMYRKLRNTLRYLLGNTFDFDPAKDAVPYDQLLELDRFILHCLSFLTHEVREHYKHYRFRSAIRSISDFCINDLSSFYLDVLKDRLYIPKAGSLERRSAQTVLHEVLTSLCRLLAPILSFTAEETWQSMRKRLGELGSKGPVEESVFLAEFPKAREEWFQSDLDLRWRRILEVRDRVNLELTSARAAGVVKNPLEAKVTLSAQDDETKAFLQASERLWPEVFLVAQVDLRNGTSAKDAHRQGENLLVSVEKAPGEKCGRCWQRRTTVGQSAEFPELCDRCASVLSAA